MASNLEQDLFKKTVVDLKTILRQGGQSTTGTKSILIQRIIETNLYTPPSQAVVPTHIIAPAGQPVYEAVPDEALRLRESLLAFILDAFDEYDFEGGGRLEDNDQWFEIEIESYEDFARKQAEELAQIDHPTLQMLGQLMVLIQSNKITVVEKEEMRYRWGSDGFILIDGDVVMTRPRF